MFEKEAEEYAEKLYGLEGSWCTNIQEQVCAIGFRAGAGIAYKRATEWHYIKDKLPPNPKESEDGKSILPLNYICAYDCGEGDYECDEFMYLGDGVWNGENKNYPIYAWMDCAVEVPPPKKENE